MYLNKAKSEYEQLTSVRQTTHLNRRIFYENQMIMPTRPHSYDAQKSNNNFTLCDENSILIVHKMEDSSIHPQQSSLKNFPTVIPQTPKNHRFSVGHHNSTPRHGAPFMHNPPWNHHFSSTPVIKLSEQRDGNYLSNTNLAHRHQFNSTPAHQNNLQSRLLHHLGADARKYMESTFNKPTDLSLNSKTAESSSCESYQEEPINYSVHSRHAGGNTVLEPQKQHDAFKRTHGQHTPSDDQCTVDHQIYLEGCGEDQAHIFHTEDTPSRSTASFNDISHAGNKHQAGTVCSNDTSAASQEDLFESHYPVTTMLLNTDKASYHGIERHPLKTEVTTVPYPQIQGKKNHTNMLCHFNDKCGTMDQTKAYSNGAMHMNIVSEPTGAFVNNIHHSVKRVPNKKIGPDRLQIATPAKDVCMPILGEIKSHKHQEVKSNSTLSTTEIRTDEFSQNFPALFSLLDISQDSACESSLSSCAASDQGHRSVNMVSTHDTNSASFEFNLHPYRADNYRAVVSQKSWDLTNDSGSIHLAGVARQDGLSSSCSVPNGVPNTFYTPQASRPFQSNSAHHPSVFATPQPQRYATRDIKSHSNQIAHPINSSNQIPVYIAPFSKTATPYRSKNEIMSSTGAVRQTVPSLSSAGQKILSSNLMAQPPPHSLSNQISSTSHAGGSYNFNVSLLGRDTSSAKFFVENKIHPSVISSSGVVPCGAQLHMKNSGSNTMKHTCLLHQSVQVKAQNKFHRCKECAYEEVQEEVRRTNDQIDRDVNEDQVLTFHTENTPSQSSGSSSNRSQAGSSGSGRAEVEAGNDIDELEFLESFQDANNLTVIEANKTLTWGDLDNTPVSGDTRTFGSTAVTAAHGNTGLMGISGNKEHGLAPSDAFPSQTSEVLHFHNDLNEGSLDQTKSYNEEGTPLCFSRVSSLSSLHSSEARDHDGGTRPVINVLGKSYLTNIEKIESHFPPYKSYLTNVEETESLEARMPFFTEKTPTVAKFEYNPSIPESPLMFSRGSSPQSLSSFDMQSIHSNVISEHSLRASDVTSPEALDSPSGSTTSKKMDSPTRKSGNIMNEQTGTSNNFQGDNHYQDQGQGQNSGSNVALEQLSGVTCGEFQTPTVFSMKSKIFAIAGEDLEHFSYSVDMLSGNLTSIITDAPHTSRKVQSKEDMHPVFNKVNLQDDAKGLDKKNIFESGLSSVNNVLYNSVADQVNTDSTYVCCGTAGASLIVPLNPHISTTTYDALDFGTTIPQTATLSNARGPIANLYTIAADSVKMASYSNTASSNGILSVLSSFIALDDVDSNEDCVKRYATEDTPSLYSSPSGLSLAPESPKKSVILSPENDAKSDNSSLWKESEELLLQQVIQSGMPKSKTGRRLPGKEFVKAGVILDKQGKEGRSGSSSGCKTLKNNSVCVNRQKVANKDRDTAGAGYNSSRPNAGESGDARSKEVMDQTPNRFSMACITTADHVLLEQFMGLTLPKSRIPRRCLREQFGEERERTEHPKGSECFDKKVEQFNEEYRVRGVDKCCSEEREDKTTAAPITGNDEDKMEKVEMEDAENHKDIRCKYNVEKVSLSRINDTIDACVSTKCKTVNFVDDTVGNFRQVTSMDAMNDKDVRSHKDSNGAVILGQESQLNHSVSCKGPLSTQENTKETPRKKERLAIAKNTEIKSGTHSSQDGTGSTGTHLVHSYPTFKENKGKTFKGFSYNNESSLLMSFRDCADVYSAVFAGNNIVELANDTDDDDVDVESFTVRQNEMTCATVAEFDGVSKILGKSDQSNLCQGRTWNKATITKNGKPDILYGNMDDHVEDEIKMIDGNEKIDKKSNLEDDSNYNCGDSMNGVMSPQGEASIQVGSNDSLDEEWMTESSMTSSSLSICSFGECLEFTPCNRGQVASFFEINDKTVGPAVSGDQLKRDKKSKQRAEKAGGKSKLKVAQSLKRLFGSVRQSKGKESHLKSLVKGKGRSPNVDLNKGSHSKLKLKNKKV